MAHKLERFSKSILNSPQLVSVEKFSEISDFFDSRNADMYQKAYEAALEANNLLGKDGNKERDLVEAKVGVLRIQGALTDKPNFFQALCGGMSYRQLLTDMDYLCSLPEVEDILMDVSSPGGEAHNCFATSRQLRAKADKAGKRLIAYIDGMSASAGYALTSAAHEVVINPDSMAGSIGVVIQLTDDSEAMKKEGYKRIFITAGESKVPFNEDGEFKKEYLDDLQNRVSELYEGFISHVATMRGIEEDVVRNTQAKMFSAKEALNLGLVDSVMEPTEFYTYLSGELASPQQLRHHEEDDAEYKANVAVTQENLTVQEDLIKMSENTVTPEMLAKMQETLEAQAAQLQAYQLKETEEAKASLSAELDKTPFLAEQKEGLMTFLMSADEENKTLMNSVIQSAKLEVEKVEEASATLLAEKETEFKEKLETAESEAEEAKLEAQKVKEEFGKGDAIEGDVLAKDVSADATSGTARTALLEAKVKAKLKAQK